MATLIFKAQVQPTEVWSGSRVYRRERVLDVVQVLNGAPFILTAGQRPNAFLPCRLILSPGYHHSPLLQWPREPSTGTLCRASRVGLYLQRHKNKVV